MGSRKQEHSQRRNGRRCGVWFSRPSLTKGKGVW